MSTITVSSVVVPQWQYGGTTAKLRIFLGTAFVSSASVPLQAGAPGGGAFYKDVTCTISGTDLTIPSFTLDSTTDGLDIQSARYSAFFYNSAGVRLKSYEGFSNFAVGPTPTTVSWADIRSFNQALQPNRDFSAYTKAQSDARYATTGSAGVADPGSNGLMSRISSNVSIGRTITGPAAGIAVTDGDGVSGNPTLALANDLAALEGLGSTGLAARTAANTWAQRTITGTAAQIAVTDGNGVSGNPTLALTGPYTPATYTSNGVLYGATAGSLLATAQGAANSVLQANAGAPAFTPTPTVDRQTVNPSAFSYDLNTNSLAVAFLFGTGPASPISFNVPVNKVLSVLQINGTNTGQGKFVGFDLQMTASGATQDIEPVRGILGRVTNTGLGNQKTTFMRGGATGSGSNASQLVGSDMDITIVAGTDAASKVYGCTVFGSTLDVCSGILIESADGARLLLGVGSIVNPVPITAAFYRAWMATASAANARALQVLNNAAGEVGYIHKDGTFQSGLAGTSLGSYSLSGNTSGTIAILPQAAAGSYNFNLPTTAGTAGQFLTSAAGGSSPMTWTSPAMVFISTVSASAQATVDFTGLDSTYDAYLLIISNAKAATDDVEAWLRVGTGGTPTYQTGNYNWGAKVFTVGAEILLGTTPDTKIVMTETTGGQKLGNATGESFNAHIRFNMPAASDFMEISYDGQYARSASSTQSSHVVGGGRYDVAGAITALRFMFSTGNVASGRFTLYGYRKS